MTDAQRTISLTIQIYRISYLILSRERSLYESVAELRHSDPSDQLTADLQGIGLGDSPQLGAPSGFTPRHPGHGPAHLEVLAPKTGRDTRASHFHPTAPTGGLLSGAPHGTDGYLVSSASPSPTGSVPRLALHVCFTPHWTILHFSLHVSWHRLLENPRLKSDWFVSSIAYQCDLFLIYLTSADVHNTWKAFLQPVPF